MSPMPFGPYFYGAQQSFYQPTSMNTGNHGNTSLNSSDSWACDYCQIATFRTFHEASQHEQTCAMNQNTLATNQSQNMYVQGITNQSPSQPPMPLSMKGDKDSLSDRQCYVRSHFVELFVASGADVSARHSKGAQKLHINQIGLRCKHCTQLRSKDRAERAMCYPSSVSRIYQTVADMQRFHFEVCTSIPSEMKRVYKTLKTTRPRGVGSPQTYWISSAKALGLVDSDNGIQFSPTNSDTIKQSLPCTQLIHSHSTFPMNHPPSPMNTSSVSSVSSIGSPRNNASSRETSSPISSLQSSTPLPPLSPEFQSTKRYLSNETFQSTDSELNDHGSEANMLLALKNTRTNFTERKLQ